MLEHDLANARGDVASAREDLQQEATRSSLLEQVWGRAVGLYDYPFYEDHARAGHHTFVLCV